MVSKAELARALQDARSRTLELVSDLSDEQLMGPRLSIVNPLLWEIGHLAWFHERWVLRHLRGEDPIRPDAEALYNSSQVAHDTRWDLPLPSREEALRYMQEVLDRILERLEAGPLTQDAVYFHWLAVFHEDMHDEAFAYTRQTLAYRAPQLLLQKQEPRVGPDGGPCGGDVEIPGGRFLLGATPELPFVFDNEKWAHPVELEPFQMARAPVTQGEFLAFVEAGGYRREECWSPQGWAWRRRSGAEHPLHWHRQGAARWLRRWFDRYLPLEEHLPVVHVNWYEAEAYCKWAGRRLPTEAEWEQAASLPKEALPADHGKRIFPWGDFAPHAELANLDGRAQGCVEVGALAAGDSARGCRQMIGNVWEWTASDFLPYPGFVADPYQDYSQPWFGTHKVLRGGCWVTRSRLIRNTWRNFYMPDRRDVWAGFRTCAVD